MEWVREQVGDEQEGFGLETLVRTLGKNRRGRAVSGDLAQHSIFQEEYEQR